MTDAQAARITAAFGDVANYRNWLKQQIIAYVIAAERASAEADWKQAQVDKALEVEADFGTIT